MLGSFSSFFAFMAHLKSCWHLLSIFFDFSSIFRRFFPDFGFWEHFSKFFFVLVTNDNFVKYSILPRKNHYFSYVELLTNNKKSAKIQRKFGVGKKQPKNALKNEFWRVLGLIWEGFGTVLGIFWTLLGDFCSYFGRSKSCFFQTWVQHGRQEAFWLDFAGVLEGFG